MDVDAVASHESFPRTFLDRPEELIQALGSHWTRYYFEGRAFVADLLRALSWSAQQAQSDLELAARCVNRHTVPPFRRVRLVPFYLRASEMVSRTAVRYGEGHLYGQGLLYGQLRTTAYYLHPLFATDVDPVQIRWITNRITRPEVVWVEGMDFTLDIDRQLWNFLDDPFRHPDRFIIQDVYNERAEAVDRELLCWGWEIADARPDLPWQHVGYVLQLATPKRAEQRANFLKFANLLWDALSGGLSAGLLYRLLSVLWDAPLPDEVETVEAIWREYSSLNIATNRRVYKFSSRAEPLVSVGDAVVPGQSLTDAFEVFEPPHRKTAQRLPYLQLGRNWLISAQHGPIGFPNREVAIRGTLVDGKLRVEFDLDGHPADVQHFFDEFHRRGLQQGRTLAQLLDRRSHPITEPALEDLPPTINPLKFAVENALRDQTVIIRLKASARGPLALDWHYFTALRNVLPPQMALLLLMDYSLPTEVLDEFELSSAAGYSAGMALTSISSPSYTESPMAVSIVTLPIESIDSSLVLSQPEFSAMRPT